MKLEVKKGMTMEELERFLTPVEAFCQEKVRKGQYDDWDEAAHTRKWLQEVLEAVNNGEERLNIYYLQENEDVIAVVFILFAGGILAKTLAKDGLCPSCENAAQLTCFHVVDRCRGQGVGRRFLETEVLSELRQMGIETIYVRSSHHRALPLYGKLGKQVGNYISVSDHGLYQRYGYIYEISLG